MRWYLEWASVDPRTRSSGPWVALIAKDVDDEGGGYFVEACDRSGRRVAEAWFGGLRDARTWAEAEWGHAAVGAWQPFPHRSGDPIEYALRKRR